MIKYFSRACFLQLFMLLCYTELSAQSKTVIGKVTDAETGKPLSGVTVTIKGSTVNTITNETGDFSIAVPASETVLKFTSVGFGYQEVRVGDRTSFNFSLTREQRVMDDVVVVGYGTKKRASVLGSVGTVQAKEIEDLPAANLATSLVNKVPGVGIAQSSGKPGSSTSLKIRNPTTFSALGNTDPLYVIDGIILSKEDFDNLDATMVDNISFLKDAAASVYGARGANGVVLVSTKRGKSGKPRISYSGSYGVSDAASRPERLNAYEHLTLLNNKYLARPAWNSLVYDQQELEYARTHNTDWLEENWENSYLQRHTLNVSGGSDKITFFAGGNYYKETGNLQDLTATRYGVRVGLNAKITSNLTADISFANDYSKQNRPTPKGIAGFAGQNADQNDELNATIGALMLIPQWVPMYIDGKAVFTTAPGWHPREVQTTNTYARSNGTGQNISASLNYKIPAIEGLTLRAQYGTNTRTTLGKEYYVSYNLYDFIRENNTPLTTSGVTKQAVIFTNDPTVSNPVRSIKNGNSLRLASDRIKSYQFNQSINYKRKFGKHDVDVLLLAEQSESDAENFFSSVEGQVIPGVDELWGFTTDRLFFDHASSSNETGRAGYLGRLNYAYDDKYMLEFVLRRDASPNFPQGSRWGSFPSLGLGWKISEEKFFRDNVKFVDDLKIRFQYGLTGNDLVGNYRYLERFTQTTGYLFGSTQTNGLNNNVVPNPNITWGKSLYKNLGFDGTFFNRKFNFAIDLYKRQDYDGLQQPSASVPTTFGIAIAEVNYSKVDSWGIEGGLTYNGKAGRDFTYSIGANIGWTDNKVLQKYYGTQDTGWKYPIGRRTDSGIEGYQSTEIFRSQAQVDAFYAKHPGWKINGDSLRVGYLNYEDINGDGVITELDKGRIAPRSGSLWGVGFNLGVGWKGIRLSVNTSLSVGGQRVYDKTARTPATENQSALSLWKDSWSPSNPNAKYPVINSPLISEVSNFWIVKGTAMRINNAQLSYSLPAAFAAKIKIPDVRVFVVGTNLWDIINNQPYKYSGSNVAVDYPSLRTFTFGLNLGL
ncbi:MAG: TonB-dependent receptor [Bacteroidota bacterium]